MSVQLGQVDLVAQLQQAGSQLASLGSQVTGAISDANALLQGDVSVAISAAGANIPETEITNLNLNDLQDQLNELLEFINELKAKIAALIQSVFSAGPSLKLPVGEAQQKLAEELAVIQKRIAVALALYLLIQSLKKSGGKKSVQQAQREQAAAANAANATPTTTTITREFFNPSIT